MEVTLESIQNDSSVLEDALRSVLSDAMTSGTLVDPEGVARDLLVNDTGVRRDDMALASGQSMCSSKYHQEKSNKLSLKSVVSAVLCTSYSTDLSCSAGFYTDLSTLTCEPCAIGFFTPVGHVELCYPCADGYTTAGTGTAGDEQTVCFPNPDGMHVVIETSHAAH